MLELVIGNKKYSSWSLRPWVLMKHFDLPFQETLIGLDLPDTAANIARYNKAGKVPVLVDEGVTVFDTLAIAEYLAEKFPERHLWPEDRRARAHARSVSAEMHSGFPNLRNDCSMKILESHPLSTLRPETRADVERVVESFNDCLAASGGPFLFGAFSIADAMYAPVVSRFRTYALPATGAARAYLEMMWNLPAMQAWVEGAQKETLRLKRYET
jgi:glutathione S-transferase